MSALAIALLVFAANSIAALAGMFVRSTPRKYHLDSESRDAVKTGMGLVATLAALVLGLLVASAKGAYDTQKNGLDGIAADVALLDSILGQYGPPASDARKTLRDTIAVAIARLWPADSSEFPTLGPAQTTAAGRSLYAEILGLSPANATQTGLQSQALQIAAGLAHERLLLIAHRESAATSGVFMVVLSFWLIALFASFGLFAPNNALVIAALLVSALSVSGAIFLTLELSQPFGGLIQISSTPLHNALAHLGE